MKLEPPAHQVAHLRLGRNAPRPAQGGVEIERSALAEPCQRDQFQALGDGEAREQLLQPPRLAAFESAEIDRARPDQNWKRGEIDRAPRRPPADADIVEHGALVPGARRGGLGDGLRLNDR